MTFAAQRSAREPHAERGSEATERSVSAHARVSQPLLDSEVTLDIVNVVGM